MNALVWVELEAKAPDHNLRELKRCASPGVIFCAVVKANAYGHGTAQMVELLPSADWFAVHNLQEAASLRALGVRKPILVLGYVPLGDMEEAFALDLRLTLYNRESLEALSTHFTMLRAGIGLYGLWPSRETYLSALLGGRPMPDLRPVLSWKTRIAQIKTLPEGSSVGYGCTYKTTRPTRVAVLPLGYAEGYDRALGNTACVPVRGRVCMNLTMIDVIDIPRPGWRTRWCCRAPAARSGSTPKPWPDGRERSTTKSWPASAPCWSGEW